MAAGAGALALDRDAGSFLDLPDVSASFSNAAALSMWVKLDAATSGDTTRTGLDSFGANTYNSHYPWTNGQAYFSTFRDGSRVDGVALSPTVDRTEWHHLAVTTAPGSGTYKVYQDGQLIRTADPGTFHIAPGGNVEKANDGGWGGLYWQDDSTSHTDEATLNNWWQLDFG